MLAEPRDSVAGEDAEDVALVIIKLRRCVTAEAQEIFAEECLDASEGEVRELWTVFQQLVDALEKMLA
jgi:hypothetical protein